MRMVTAWVIGTGEVLESAREYVFLSYCIDGIFSNDAKNNNAIVKEQ